MGGKSKNRVKNNALPSSSSRASNELAANSGIFGVFQFNSSPFVGNSDAKFLQNADPEINVILKKMWKKDAVTRCKALQEFIAYLEKVEDESTLKSIVAQFTQFYQNLASDNEHNVRELANSAMQKICEKNKRSIAPQIKKIAPVLIASRFDNYSPAALTARKCFDDTFPSNDKRQQVCLLCENEIFEYCLKNITFNTPSILMNNNQLTPEEADQKFRRLIIGSFKTLSFFLENANNSLDGDNLEEAKRQFASLLENKKFWSFVKDKNASVKSSWFELMLNLQQRPCMAEVLAPVKTQIIAVCCSHIDEKDASVATFVWSCLLLLQANFDDWHTHVDMDKFLGKMSRLTRNLHEYNSEIICPNLLPLFDTFARFDQEILPNHSHSDFCKQFFGDLLASIKTEGSGYSSCKKAAIKAKFECFRYLTAKLSEKQDLVFSLLDECVIQTVLWYIETGDNQMFDYIAHLVDLLRFWNEKVIEKPENEFYKKLLEHFADKMAKQTSELIENNSSCEDKLTRIVQIIYHFSDLNGLEAECSEFDAIQLGDIQRNTVGFLPQDLKKISAQLVRCILFNEQLSKKPACLLYVHSFLKLYLDQSFCASVCGLSEGDSQAPARLLEKLTDLIVIYRNDRQASILLIDVIFEIVARLTIVERWIYIKERLLVIKATKTQALIVQRLLNSCFIGELKAAENSQILEMVNDTLLNIGQESIAQENASNFLWLENCFAEYKNMKWFLRATTLESIYKNFVGSLNATLKNESFLKACLNFIGNITETVIDQRIAGSEVLRFTFLQVYDLIIKNVANNALKPELMMVWKFLLKNEQLQFDIQLAEKCSSILEEYVFNNNSNVDFIKSNSDILVDLMLSVVEANLNIDFGAIIVKLLKTQYIDESLQRLSNVASYAEAMKLNISVNKPEDFFNLQFEPIDFTRVFQIALLNAATISRLLEKLSECSTSSDSKNFNASMDSIFNANLDSICNYIKIAAIGHSFTHFVCVPQFENLKLFNLELLRELYRLVKLENDFTRQIKDQIFLQAIEKPNAMNCRSMALLMDWFFDYEFAADSISVLPLKETLEDLLKQDDAEVCLNCWQYLRPISQTNIVKLESLHFPTANLSSLWSNSLPLRLMLSNTDFKASVPVTNREAISNVIIPKIIEFITDVSEKQYALKNVLLFNVDINEAESKDVINIVEYINLLVEVLNIHYDLTVKNWDSIRVGLSSWVLSVSKTLNSPRSCYEHFKVPLFFKAVFKLFAALTSVLNDEKQRSSTKLLSSVFDEWQKVFAREVNTVLFKVFHKLCSEKEKFYEQTASRLFYDLLMEQVCDAVESIDYAHVYSHYKAVHQLDELLILLFSNLMNPIHRVRTVCAFVFRGLTPYFVKEDSESLDKVVEKVSKDSEETITRLTLDRFEDYIIRYDMLIEKYVEEFTFKITELTEFEPIERDLALGFLLMWDCIIYLCSQAPTTLRPTYTNWLHAKKYEETFLHFLFRAMPVEILRNHDVKNLKVDLFRIMEWSEIQNPNLKHETYACHLYATVLRKLPAIVRQWWSASASRPKTFIDKLTTNFISNNICCEELKAVYSKNENSDDFQVTVHATTREVIAVYSIEEAKMELIITLAQNHPLGGVKVECGKQIGGRSMSRNIGMQLSLYLMHQNGSLSDGLTIWKQNLDKKFAGVEECYICYTVIHQDTCQLPKLTCKTCKKKFHSPCLYKWFTSSSKSTCPICRNVF